MVVNGDPPIPPNAPGLNPVEGVWTSAKESTAGSAPHHIADLVAAKGHLGGPGGDHQVRQGDQQAGPARPDQEPEDADNSDQSRACLWAAAGESHVRCGSGLACLQDSAASAGTLSRFPLAHSAARAGRHILAALTAVS
jgi:hypothetical protein